MSDLSNLSALKAEDAALRHWLPATTAAAAPFERRWQTATLKRVNENLHDRLRTQRNLFDQAVVTGTAEDIERHGAALCRGWALAVAAMAAAGREDDAYLVGQDPASGLIVAIGENKASAARVRELHGNDAVWVTPDEVASIWAQAELIRLKEIKQRFPGATIEAIRQTRQHGSTV